MASCECKKEAKLSWVRGNDVLLSVWLYERYLDGDEEKLRPIVLEDSERLSVRFVNRYGRAFDMHPNVGEDQNQLIIDVPGTIPTGLYSLEVKIRKMGREIRSFESCMIRIVESNCEANTVFTPVESGHNAETEMTVQMLSQAESRGKSAYELWLDAGNTGTLQDYLDTFTQSASRTQDGLMTSEAYRKLESIEEMPTSDVEDSWNGVFGN